MKPLFSIVASILVLTTSALPENIADIKELPQTKEPIVEAEASEVQARVERCTTCPGPKLNLKNRGFLAPLTQLPNAEVHTQQSFEGCSSDKGCAGIKVKDGRVIERFGNDDTFRNAAASNTGNEFTFHAAGTFDNNLLGLNQPFWWMDQNSPFKNGGGSFEKSFSKSSSSFSTTGNGNAGNFDINANPFLNGDLSKIASGFNGGAAVAGEAKPSTFQSSAFESSSFSSSNKEADLAKNPFLNGGFNNQFGNGFANGQSVSQFEQSASQFGQGFGATGAGKFGYTGSSPSPFTAPGTNVNLIQNSQKASEFDFESQSQAQQNIDEAFKHTGNVNAHEHSGGELQQTCAGQGYACVHKAQCNNGVVNTNGGNLLQANTKKQYCNIRTEICCRIEVSSLAGAGGLQGSLGVGSGTYSGSNSQGTGLFVSQSGQNSQSGFSQTGNQAGNSQNGFSQTGSQGNSQSGFNSVGQTGSGSGSSFNQNEQGFGQSGTGFTQTSQSSFNSVSQTEQSGANGQGFRQNGQKGQNGFGASGTAGFGINKNFGQGSQGTFGSGFEQESSTFEETRGNKFNGFGSTATPVNTNRFNGNSGSVNEVFKSTSQSNFIETDSFSAGSENSGVYRPGQPGTGLKPGIPYLPPVDSSTSSTNQVTSTFVTQRPTPRPTTPRPIKPYVPSTQAPGYLPPQGESSNNKETRLPIPKPTSYDEGSIILDETRQPTRPPIKRPINPVPAPNDVPSGCAAALKCTPVEFCTSEGVISNTTVVLTRDQEAYRVPLTDCKDIESGRIGKCCRDPYYTDPWPTNQLGKWVPGVFGGNDGQYVPDSRGSSNNNVRPATLRPPVTGSIYKDNFQQPKPTTPTFGPNSITPGFPSSTPVYQGVKGQGQYTAGGQGQYSAGGQGQYSAGGQGQYSAGGQGQYNSAGQGISSQFGQGNQITQTTSSYGQSSKRVTGQGIGVTQGQGIGVSQGQGVGIIQGQGSYSQGGKGQFDSQGQAGQNVFTQTQAVSQNRGTGVIRGQGQSVTQGQGQIVSQGQGQLVSQGQGVGVIRGSGQTVTGQGIGFGQGQAVSQGSGFGISQGQGQIVKQGAGFGISQGSGQTVSQGAGFGVSQGQGQSVSQGAGFGVSQGQGQSVSQGAGFGVSQGAGFGISQGSGIGVSQGGGFNVITQNGVGVENDYSESVQRVFLSQYSAGGQCGLLNPQKPYGNRNDLEADFAEIPWQAMVLLQTNRSLLCGGIITRPDVVITAAQCVDGLQAKNVLIKGGEWKLGIDDEPLPYQIVQVKSILRHPLYRPGLFINDVAILVLSEDLRLAKNIYPICLPGAKDTLDAFYNGAGECIVTGWGKSVLQTHQKGSIIHSLNVSLLNPGECQAKLSQDYPHLLETYDQESCACGEPTNPVNNICKVDVGSALACTTGDGHYVLRGVYSWDSGCQIGNQLAGFYKFDLEWYEWAIGLIESVRYGQYSTGSKISQNIYSSQINSGIKSSQFGIKGSQIKGGNDFGLGLAQGQIKGSGEFGLGQVGQVGQFSQFGSSKYTGGNGNLNFGSELKGPLTNTFSATYTEKKVFQSEPKFVTYTTKPEIVTFTTKPEYFTYTTKPKLVTYTTKPEIVTFTTKPEIVTYTTKPKIISYTTKPQIIRYETSGSGTNPQFVAPDVTFNPSFSEVVGHKHSGTCKCLEGK